MTVVCWSWDVCGLLHGLVFCHGSTEDDFVWVICVFMAATAACIIGGGAGGVTGRVDLVIVVCWICVVGGLLQGL